MAAAADGAASASGAAPAPRFGRRVAGWGDPGSDGGSGGGAASPPSRRVEAAGGKEGWDEKDGEADGPAGAGRGKWGRSKPAPGTGTDAGDEVAIIRDDGAADGTDDLATQIANAPRNAAGRKVATLRELTADSTLDVAASRMAGVDLSLLTSVLAAPDMLVERDEEWHFERLLQDVAQEITAEQDRREAEDAGGGAAAPATAAAPAAGSSATRGGAGAGAGAGAGSR